MRPSIKKSLEGGWTVLFFGYTNCPDVCPTTIYKLAEIKNGIKEDLPSANFNTVLVTLDPDRDSAERLDEYIGYFDETMLGVTGTYENIQSFTSSLSVFYQRINKEEFQKCENVSKNIKKKVMILITLHQSLSSIKMARYLQR